MSALVVAANTGQIDENMRRSQHWSHEAMGADEFGGCSFQCQGYTSRRCSRTTRAQNGIPTRNLCCRAPTLDSTDEMTALLVVTAVVLYLGLKRLQKGYSLYYRFPSGAIAALVPRRRPWGLADEMDYSCTT